MAKYIECEAAIAYIKENQCKRCFDIGLCGKCAVLSAVKLFESVPAADVRPVGRAAWQSWEQNKPPCKWYSCGYCGFHALSESNYCPNCGAKMEEDPFDDNPPMEYFESGGI